MDLAAALYTAALLLCGAAAGGVTTLMLFAVLIYQEGKNCVIKDLTVEELVALHGLFEAAQSEVADAASEVSDDVVIVDLETHNSLVRAVESVAKLFDW